MAFRIFRLPSHQQFDYKPRYWDPKKEELEDRLQQLERLQRADLEGMKSRISSGLRHGRYVADSGVRRRQVNRSNYTLVIIIGILLVAAYLILQVYIPEIESFSK